VVPFSLATMALRLLPSVHAFLLAQVKSGTSTVVKFQVRRWRQWVGRLGISAQAAAE